MKPAFPRPGGYIDCHTHLFPNKRLRKLVAWSRSFMPDHPVPADVTAEDAIADLRRAGARRWVNLLFPLWPGEAPELHRFNAELADRHPEITPFGGVLPEDSDPLGVVQEAIERWGMSGIKFHPMVQHFSPAHPALAPIFPYLEANRRSVFIHTGFDEWYGWHLDLDGIEGLVTRHPGLAFVLAHMAYPRLDWAFDLADRHANVWLDLTNVVGVLALAHQLGTGHGPGFLSATEAKDAAAVLASRLPSMADRVMFGSDHPAGMGDLERILGDLAVLDLDESTLEQVLLRTAGAFLNRYGRPAP